MSLTPAQTAALSCQTLSAGTLCGPGFAGWPILIDPTSVTEGMGFASEKDFDGIVAKTLRPDASAFNDTQRGCPVTPALATAMAQMRYQASFLCVDAVRTALSGMRGSVNLGIRCSAPSQATPSDPVPENKDPGNVILCSDFCDSAVTTYTNLYVSANCNPAPQWLALKVASRRENCKSMTNALTSASTSAGKCWLGVSGEQAQCGFASGLESAAFCKKDPTNVCCSLPVGVSYATWSQSQNGWVFPSVAGGSIGGGDNGGSKGAVIGGVIGGLVVLGLIAGAGYYYCKYRGGLRGSGTRKMWFQNEVEEDVAAHVSRNRDFGTYPPGHSQPSGAPYLGSGVKQPDAASYVQQVSSYKREQQQQQQQLQMQSTPATPTTPVKALNNSMNLSKIQQQQIPLVPLAQPPSPKSPIQQEIVRIIHAYEATMQDELSLIEGNDLICVKRFDDGWAQGIDPISGRQGAFPLVCVSLLKDLPQLSFVKGGSIDKQRLSKRMSSILSVPSVAPPPPASQKHVSVSLKQSAKQKTVRIMFEYQGAQGDELTLVPGNDIIVLKQFDDGWALGMNPMTGQKGAFPMACVSADAEDGPQLSGLSKRASSLMGDWN
ncbi:SH3-domain kinase binding protein 1 [Chytriomyces hyalinus]|nr:SH3-domain kinase binding protein 1 [Chytriomyces hyalinus]